MADSGPGLPIDDGPGSDEDRSASEAPLAAIAMEAASRFRAGPKEARPVLLVACSERRAERLAAALGSLLPDRPVRLFPRWDCLPEEPLPPARDITGRRVAVLAAIGEEDALVLVASPDALLVRVAPCEVLRGAARTIAPGDPLDVDDLERWFRRTGWILDDRVDEPGEAAVRGKVVDVYPADAAPVRIEHEGGRVVGLHDYDPVSQRTNGERAGIRLLPASEVVMAGEAGDDEADRPMDVDHRVAALVEGADDFFQIVSPSVLLVEPGVDERFETLFADGPEASRYPSLRIEPEAWKSARGNAEAIDPQAEPLPVFALARSPGSAFRRAAEAVLAEGGRVFVATSEPRHRDAFRKAMGRPIPDHPDPAALADAPPATLARIPVDFDAGFARPGLIVAAAADLLGRRARPRPAGVRHIPEAFMPTDADLAIGDTVVHRDHGLAILAGLESAETAGLPTDMLRLDFAGGTHRLVPVREIGRIWRYGADPDEVTLDRLDGGTWEKRRAKVEEAIRRSVAGLAEAARARQEAEAPRIRPPRTPFERFVARFPYSESDDQAAAIDAVLADLASGRPMDRLVCGDVGYGKTEVALRAAAAVALSGRQVAIVAPTTVLARQHEETFRRRFAGLGVEIAALSRLVRPTDARRVKAGLADGSVRVVIGTHAVAGRGVAFADLGLMVIDEEQRFGAAHKQRLRALADGRHVLSLSATPIPRTLQAALAGLQDLSVIATPPVSRRPIRTVVMPEDGPTIRDALLRERARGGQSFVVCPRIEDMEPVAERLAALVPDLVIHTVHGRLAAETVDRLLVEFGRGEGDVLLATTIIESGLDMPCVNTMVVIHADRFGLAELHQLRGRVGRGRRRGAVYLTTEPGAEITPSAEKRLATLAALDQLGAGFDIAARDLEQRGAGDLLGEEQAGHVRLIGAGFYRHLLSAALATAKGEPPPADPPVVEIGQPGRIPEDLVPEPDVRIGLYARLAALEDAEDADAFAQEFADRFGDPGDDLASLIAAARIGALARAVRVTRVEAGPAGVALTFADTAAAIAARDAPGDWKGERLVLTGNMPEVADRAAAAERMLTAIAAGPDRA